jgi:ABC-type lipopolysaccharide export system ATPase subunit
VCLHLPLFAAAASYCDSAGLRVEEPDGSFVAGAPRLILLDEVFAGVDEDNRGELFEIVRRLDLDLVATSESDQGLYEQLDGLSIYQLVTSDDAVLAARTVWDGRSAHQLLNDDLGPFDADDAGLFSE